MRRPTQDPQSSQFRKKPGSVIEADVVLEDTLTQLN
ncbi:hypothetical protein LOK49_LG12G00743 [Camellia lanceoleosa]|uniref:Uncharacterized protein n=1 Tax=Camellia lanceoleosa TaxID=1840588 RepID=A0ACC0FV18_9ERIC|nr:hypothetical protein LOK49_LG12G00743 [Camellia lanceoleosa]